MVAFINEVESWWHWKLRVIILNIKELINKIFGKD